MGKTKTVLELISFLKRAQRSKVFTAVLDSMIKQFDEKPYLKTNTDTQIMHEDYASESTINFTEFREIVARVVDGSDFIDFKPLYGVSTVCIQAKIHGHSCVIIGNNGPIDPNGATKSAQFIQLCGQSKIPIIFFSNTTGFMVGKQYEQLGMIKLSLIHI